MTGFQICRGKGFYITFENGWTVSVQFGPGNYCDNYNLPIGEFYEGKIKLPTSSDAEVAAWGPSGDWLEFEHGDTVNGKQSPAEVLAFLNEIAARAPIGDP